MRYFKRIEERLLATKRWGRPAPEVAERAKHKCEYCDMDLMLCLEKYKQWSIDHIIPRSAGGTEDLDNLALACWHCNGHLKGKWNPDSENKRPTREELIKRVRKYLDEEIRPKREDVLKQDQDIIGYVNGQLRDPHPMD